jgi:uncharacterized protein YegL
MKVNQLLLWIVSCTVLFIVEFECRPQSNFIITTEPTSSIVAEPFSNDPQPPPKIVDMNIRSDIQYRYAKTIVKSYVKNPSASMSQEVTFIMVLPSTAFISNFTMQVNGKDTIYVARVAEKEEAKKSYNEAITAGQSAGIVDADTRDASQITVRSNLEAAGKMIFTLTYEELLERHNSMYEQVIHVNPGQVVPVYNVDVYINESLPVTNLNVPELKLNPNEITSQLSANEIATIERNIDGDSNKVHIHFNPTPEDQNRMGELSKNKENGMSGQFIVQYDVDRKNQTNEIQILDGYFVHFFAPDTLDVLPKHVVFVLDVSGSMEGTKLQQTKDAMLTILDDLSDQDYFNVLTFSDDVYHWTPKLQEPSVNNSSNVEKRRLTHKATKMVRKEAVKYVLGLRTIGGTNIHDGLKESINVVKNVRISESVPSNVKPIIIFLTDGEATAGVTDSQDIRKNVKSANRNLEVPIYGLAFGDGADFGLVKDISTESEAFARRIYEASDAPIQLEDFYQEIASPLLSNVTFDYVGESFQNKTNKSINTYFKGGEYVVAGKVDGVVDQDDELEIVVSGIGKSANYKEIISRCIYYPDHHTSNFTDYDECCDELYCDYSPHPCDQYMPSRHVNCIPWPITPILPDPISTIAKGTKSDAENFIERLWAFLTIQNILNEDENKDSNQAVHEEEESDKDKALDLSLKYNFVTELTSLVVIKPNDEEHNDANYVNGTVVNVSPVSLKGQEYVDPYGAVNYKTASYFYNGYAGSVSGVPTIIPKSGSPSNYYSDYSYDTDYSYGGALQYGGPDLRSSYGGSGDDTYLADITTFPVPTNLGPSLNENKKIAAHDFSNSVSSVVSIKSASDNCSISLFDKTLLRGNNLILKSPTNVTVPNLSVSLFDDKLISFEVIGPCCWTIFEDPNFSGYNKIFSQGKYKSSTSLGPKLVLEASSIKMSDC